MRFPLLTRLAAIVWWFARTFAWCLLGLWTALAMHFTVPLPSWLAIVLPVGVFLLYLSATRERLYVRGRTGIPWRETCRSIAALAVTAGVAVWYFGFVIPNQNEDWTLQHARMPHVEIEGDEVHVNNVRDFTWRSATDFTPNYQDRVYDLNKINSMYYVLSPISALNGVAHVWVGFGFSDGQHVAVSVEARGVKERPYGLLQSMFRQFQLIYVIGEERDVVGLRGAIWKNEVRFYPARTTPDRMRALFLDIMQRAHSLEEKPEWYHLLTNNCMNNITYHLRRLGGRSVPSDLRLILTGFSDRVAHEYGFIDTDLPFEKAHQAYRIDQWMQTVPLDDQFSLRLREALRRQGADKIPS